MFRDQKQIAAPRLRRGASVATLSLKTRKENDATTCARRQRHRGDQRQRAHVQGVRCSERQWRERAVDGLRQEAEPQSAGEHPALELAWLGSEQRPGVYLVQEHHPRGVPHSWQLLVDGSAQASGNVATGTEGVSIAGFDTAPDAWHNLARTMAQPSST
jgi:hypothetical protein